MPIEMFKEHSFSPEVIQTLVEALDIAWKALQANRQIPPEQMREKREELARHILDMAKRGDYTADVLAAYAVARVGR